VPLGSELLSFQAQETKKGAKVWAVTEEKGNKEDMMRRKEYTPRHLRPVKPEPTRERMFAIGEEHRPHEFGMWHGPNRKEEEMLEIEGKSSKSCIIRFNEDYTEDVIWRWHRDRWISVE